jgi:DNA-binding MarR family transcriptional regulator
MKTSEREMARKLRQEGLSVREIEGRVGVARSSVSVWVRDVELTPEQREVLRCRPRPSNADAFRRRRLLSQSEGREAARRLEPLHAMGCMLFWAEGSRSVDAAKITNSDPALLRLAARFLRQYFDVRDEKFRVWCNLFADHLEKQHAIEQHWLDTLELPRECLTKSIVNVYSRYSKKRRRNKLPYGTCRLTVCDVRIAQHLYGAIQEYGSFERPEWLETPRQQRAVLSKR